MKKTIFCLLVVITAAFGSCAGHKAKLSPEFYGTLWELEYSSGVRIAFEGLFPEKKPQITFTESEKMVLGTTGCNGYSASFEIKNDALKIGAPGPMTMRFCEGGGERVFLEMMQKVDAYHMEKDGTLHLTTAGVTMLRFKKINQ